MHLGVVFQGTHHMCFIVTVKEMKEIKDPWGRLSWRRIHTKQEWDQGGGRGELSYGDKG